MAIDFDALFGGAEYDPCAALQALRPAYMKMVAGQTPDVVKFRDREVSFRGQSLEQFEALIRQLETECRAKNGDAPRRFAITVGAVRRGPPSAW